MKKIHKKISHGYNLWLFFYYYSRRAELFKKKGNEGHFDVM